MAREPVTIGGVTVAPGTRATIDLSLGQLYNHNPISMPVHVVHGRRAGPQVFVCAAVHGDELNGVEIMRRLLATPALRQLRGTLLAVPMVNVLGVLHHSRYLPDRRDLNRCFPGSETGSLAARLAHLFMREIVSGCTHGIDLHTGAQHRANYPQIRAALDEPETLQLARAFAAQVLLNSDLRDGSLRAAAGAEGVRMLVYEAGEALRFDERCIRTGVAGVLGVLRELGMLRGRTGRTRRREPFIARSSYWVRSPGSGIVRMLRGLGDVVSRNDVLARISDPFGEVEVDVQAAADGVIIGRSNLPLAHEGDALVHIARFPRGESGDGYAFDDAPDDDSAWLPEEPPIV